MTTSANIHTDRQPLDLDPIRERRRALEDAWDFEYRAPDGPAKAIASAEDVPALLAEVEWLREDSAELAQARAVVAGTRQMAIDANTRLREQLLAALGQADDGRTPLNAYVAWLVAQRDALKLALAPGGMPDGFEVETHWGVDHGDEVVRYEDEATARREAGGRSVKTRAETRGPWLDAASS